MESSQNKSRIWELDFLRGIALVLMVYFHIVYDLKEILHLPVSYETGINYYIGKLSAVLFIFISGISSSLSGSNIRRGLKVLSFAIVITIVSHLYGSLYGVKFGILHFLGVSMLLSPLFMKLNKTILFIISLLAIFPGALINKLSTSLDFLFPVGITGSKFISSDYYPLIPWIGFFLLGILAGRMFYKTKQSIFKFEIKDNILSMIGQKTLIVYLLHQPVIIAVLNLFK